MIRFRRKVAVFDPSLDAITPSTGYWIGYVFVPEAQRRNGYGRHLMRLLHHVMAVPPKLPPFPEAWGSPPLHRLGDAVVSILHTTVGEFYVPCGAAPGYTGWTTAKKQETIWRTEEHRPSAIHNNVELLDEIGLETILLRDEDLMLQELRSPASPARKRFTFLPAGGLVAYNIRYFQLTPDEKPANALVWPPKVFGAQVTDESSSELCFAAWTFQINPAPSKLNIIRLRCNAASLGRLVRAALDVAVEAGVEKVEAWNLSDELVEAATMLDGKTADAGSCWPCMAWYDNEGEEVEWRNIEKYV